jgi:Nucleotide-diphospho-sugar transferase
MPSLRLPSPPGMADFGLNRAHLYFLLILVACLFGLININKSGSMVSGREGRLLAKGLSAEHSRLLPEACQTTTAGLSIDHSDSPRNRINGLLSVRIPRIGLRASRNLLLTYVWGSCETQGLHDVFVRSFRRVQESPADLVFLYHGCTLDDRTQRWASQLQVRFVEVPADLWLHASYRTQNWVMARFAAWHWFLHQHKNNYSFVAHSDSDVVFQRDPFSAGCGAALPGLHFFEENLDILLKEDRPHREHMEWCPLIAGRPGRDFLAIIPEGAGRVCAGYVQGDADSMDKYLELMSREMGNESPCNDQVVLNALVWGRSLPPVPFVVWTSFTGPVKTLDVGYYRDRFGLAYTNFGQPYCVLHQYKPDRAPSFFLLWQKIANTNRRDSLVTAPRFCAPGVSECAGAKESLGEKGGTVGIPTNDVPSELFYTPMPDSRFPSGVHEKAVSRMLAKGFPLPPPFNNSKFGEEWDLWGATVVSDRALPSC